MSSQIQIPFGQTKFVQIWFIFLLLWNLMVGLVKQDPLAIRFPEIRTCLIPKNLPHFFVTALFSSTAVPHRTYAQTCCLLA